MLKAVGLPPDISSGYFLFIDCPLKSYYFDGIFMSSRVYNIVDFLVRVEN